MLNVEAQIEDGTAEGGWEIQTIWVKIPWPTRVG